MLLIFLIVGAVAVLAHTAPFPFLLEAFHPGRSVWRMPAVAGAPPTVYLTFDDGPNETWTPAVLDVLAEAQVSATFFLIDDHLTSATAPVVRRIADEGHAIGLHSNTRRLMAISPTALGGELKSIADRITAVTGRAPCRAFRPHAGWRSSAMYAGLKREGYRLIGWSWGMWDWNWWRGRNPDSLAARLGRKASRGDIIVIHDGHHVDPKADRRHAGETVRRLIPALRARGFSFGTVCSPAAATPLGDRGTDAASYFFR